MEKTIIILQYFCFLWSVLCHAKRDRNISWAEIGQIINQIYLFIINLSLLLLRIDIILNTFWWKDSNSNNGPNDNCSNYFQGIRRGLKQLQ